MDNSRLESQDSQFPRNSKISSHETVLKLLTKAQDFSKLGQLDLALKTLHQCVLLKPDFDETYQVRAELFRQLGQFPKALADLTQAIELNPHNPAAFVQRAEIYRLLRQPQQALNDLNQAIELDPDNPLALGRRGTVYRILQELAKSLADYDLALKLDPSNTWLYGNRAETYRALHEYRKAINDYTQVLKLNPQLSWVYERRSYANLRLGYLDSAWSDFKNSWEANPTKIMNGWMAEWTRMCKKGFSFSAEVEDSLWSLVELAPQQYAAYLCRSSLYWLYGEFEESYAEAATACEIEPGKGEGYFWKGMAAAGLEENEEALGLMHRALEMKLLPVLLSPCHWLKQTNLPFYQEFERQFLGKRGPVSSEDEITTTLEVKNDRLKSLEPEINLQQTLPLKIPPLTKPVETTPGETPPEIQKVKTLESDTTTKLANFTNTPAEVDPEAQTLKTSQEKGKQEIKEPENLKQKPDLIKPELNTIENIASENISTSPELAKPDLPAGVLTPVADSGYKPEPIVNSNKSATDQELISFNNVAATNEPDSPVKRGFITGLTLLIIGLLAVGFLGSLIKSNQDENRPVNSQPASQSAFLPVPSAVTSPSTVVGKQTTTNPVSAIPTNPITTIALINPTQTPTTNPVSSVPVNTTEPPTAVLAINVSPDPGTTNLLAELQNFSNQNLTGHSSFIFSVAFSPDGKLLASGSNDNTIRLWNVSQNGLNQTLASLEGHQAAVYSVAFSPDGKLLASGSADSTIKLWQISTTTGGPIEAKELATLKGHTAGVNLVSFSPDGTLLGSASDDKTIRLWNVANGQLVRTLEGHNFLVNSVAFSPNGRTLASASNDKTVKLWEVSSGKVLANLTGHGDVVNSVAFSPDGRVLASASNDRTIKLWNVSTGKELASLNGHPTGVTFVTFSPDGRTLASGGTDFTIKLWNVRQLDQDISELATFQSSSVGVFSIAFSQDGKTLAVASRSQVIKLWDFDSNLFNTNT